MRSHCSAIKSVSNGLVGAADQRCERTVVVVGIDPVDALMLDSADARAEAQAQHGEGGEIDLRGPRARRGGECSRL